MLIVNFAIGGRARAILQTTNLATPLSGTEFVSQAFPTDFPMTLLILLLIPPKMLSKERKK
jgi:hypothetical protein